MNYKILIILFHFKTIKSSSTYHGLLNERNIEYYLNITRNSVTRDFPNVDYFASS